MEFRYCRMDRECEDVICKCGCLYCNGGEQKATVAHYKLWGLSFDDVGNPFENGEEYYLNIDMENKEMYIEKKM